MTNISTYAKCIMERANTPNSHVKAVLYARTSTENEGQKDSCANQIEFAKKYVSRFLGIEIVGEYVDDGISGRHDHTRPQYTEMMCDVSRLGVELIVVKSLSRLNRDEHNSYSMIEHLKEVKATILTFEDGQIHDFEDDNQSLLTGVKFITDALYSKTQSKHGKLAHTLRCTKKQLTAKDVVVGYSWDRETKTVAINDAKAQMIRKIFEKYVYERKTPNEITQALKDEGVERCSRSVTNIITCEKYVGRFYINTMTTDSSGKKVPLPKDEWVLVDRPDLKIVDEDLFDLAQRLHSNKITIHNKPDKRATQSYFQGTHLFSAKIYCRECGQSYRHDYADRKGTKPIYRVKSHKGCSNPIDKIREQDLDDIIREVMVSVFDTHQSVLAVLKNSLEVCIRENSQSTSIKANEEKLNKLNRKLDIIVDALANCDTAPARLKLKEKMERVSGEIETLERDLADLRQVTLDDKYIEQTMARIDEALRGLKDFNEVTREKVLNYIDKIEVTEVGDMEITLNTQEKTGMIGVAPILSGTDGFGKMRREDGLY